MSRFVFAWQALRCDQVTALCHRYVLTSHPLPGDKQGGSSDYLVIPYFLGDKGPHQIHGHSLFLRGHTEGQHRLHGHSVFLWGHTEGQN